MRLVGDIQGRHYQLKDIIIHSGDTFPSDMHEGQLFYRSDLHQLYVYNGSSWTELLTSPSSSGPGVSSGHVTTLIVDATSDFGRHMYIRDEMIIINYGETGAGVTQWGTTKAGIQVDRGSLNAVSIFYDDATDRWTVSNDGINNRILVVEDDTNYFLRLDGTNTPTADINMNSHAITNLSDPTNPQDAATKNYVDGLIGAGVFLALDGSNTPTGNISWNNHLISSLADPINNQDAANKQYVDKQFTDNTQLGYAHYLRLDGSNKPTNDIDWDSNKIINLSDPTNNQDASTKKYVDDNISTLSSAVLHLDGSTVPTADISMGNNKITGLATPTGDTDAVTKKYVDDNFSLSSHTHDYSTILNTPDDDNFYTALTEKSTIDDGDYLLIYSISDGQYMKIKRSTLIAGTLTPTANLDVWIIGGFDGTNYLDNVDAYNSSVDSWTSLVSNLSIPSRAKMMATRIDSVIYVVNGFDGGAFRYTDAYTISTDTWNRETDAPSPSKYDNLIVGDDTQYLFNINGYSGSSIYLKYNNMYDTVANSWSTKLDALIARSTLAGAYNNSGIYAIGGYDGSSYLDDNHFYDIASDSWTNTGFDMPTARRDAVGAAIGNYVYVISGYDGTTFLRTNERFNVVASTWETKTDIPLPGRTDATASVYDSNKILVMSGFDGTYYLRDVDEYNDASDSWTSRVNIPTPARQDSASG